MKKKLKKEAMEKRWQFTPVTIELLSINGKGPNAIDITPDIPASDFYDVTLFYYLRQIKVIEAAAHAADITLRTNDQGGNSNSKAI